MPTSKKNTVKISDNRIDLDIDLKSAKVDVIGSDIILTLSNGTQKTLQGLAIQLFSNNPPQIFSKGKAISADDFLQKIGQVEAVDIKEIKDVLTTLKNSSGQAETDKKVETTEKIVIKEVVKFEQVFTDTSSSNKTQTNSTYGDTQTIENERRSQEKQKEQDNSLKAEYDLPLEDLEPRKVTFSSPPRPSNNPLVDEGFGNGFTSLSSRIKLLQTPYQLGFDEDTNILTVRGGGGALSAAFNDSRSTQVDPELIDLSEYVGETEIFTDNDAFFNDNLITRVVSFEALMPLQYQLSKLEISGLPSGFSFLGHTPDSDGVYNFSTFNLFGGRIQLLLQYDPNQFSNTPSDLDGDGIAAEYASFELDFAYEAALLTEETEISDAVNTIDTNLQDETTIPVVVKQANLDDFLYHSNPEGWVIDIDFNDNVLLTGNSDATVYGSPARDNITSGLGNDTIMAGAGNDIIRTGVGQDFISGGTGSNSIDAGAGVDTLTYEERTEDISLNLSEGADQDGFYTATLGDFTDLIRAIENLILGSGDDTLRGSLDNNVIEGRDGNDILDGGLGNDTLLGGNGNDTLRSGFGNNILDGGTGINTLEYAQSETGISANQVTLDDNGFYDITNGSFVDKVKNIDVLRGSNFDDVILGDNSNDIYATLDGDDFIDAGEGNDIIDGGEGDDTVSYASLTSGGISVSGGTVIDANSNVENLLNVEAIQGTNFDDSFIGTSEVDRYSGLDGNDNFITSLGADIISGGAGYDTIDTSVLGIAVVLRPILQTITSSVNNQVNTSFSTIEAINGTADVDLIDYSSALNTVTVNLTTNTAQQTGQALFNVANFDNVTTGSGNDIITGSISDNIFLAGNGNDNIYASGGTDTISGGTGSDTFHINTTQDGTINLSNQTISGFAGSDIASDTISSIENITQTGSGDTTIIGSTSNNILTTGSGDDIFSFSNGNDTINAGNGIDTFDYSSVTIDTNLDLSTINANGFATFNSGLHTTLLKSIENIIASAENDIIIGNDSNNNIMAGDGDDIIDGGRGLDVIDGGDGTDTATYQSLNSAVTVSGTSVVDGDSNVENLTNIEIIAGTNYGDIFNGTFGGNHYQGLAGDDIFTASLGIDTLEGGDGFDALRFNNINTNTTLLLNLGLNGLKSATGSGLTTNFNRIETIIGSFQTNDTITYGTTTEDITVDLQASFATGIDGDADYTISGFENVTGGAGANRIQGDANINFLQGGSGTNTLLSNTNQDGTINLASVGNQISGFTGGDNEFTGDTIVGFDSFEHTGTGNINITGSSGSNIIRTGSGNDTIQGDDGADILDGNFATAQRVSDVVFDTFEGVTNPAGWQIITNVAASATVDSSNATFTDFLGRVGDVSGIDQSIVKTYNVTGTKEHAVIEFDFYEIDSWDYERVDININDTLIFNHLFQGIIEEFSYKGSVDIGGMTVDYIITPQTEVANIGFLGSNDQIHKIRLLITNPTSEITLSLKGYTNEAITNESWGLDNVLFYTTNNLSGLDDGVDILSYAADSVGVNIDLNDDFSNNPSDPNQTASGTGSDADGDTIRNFDNVIGGSGDDTIAARYYATNIIDAGAGDDRVVAAIGTGHNFDGGSNNVGGDTLVVKNTRNTITDLTLNNITHAEYGDDLFGTTFANFENYESTAFTHEKIIGNTANNTITTGFRDDYLVGGVGNDVLDGGANYLRGGDWVGYENVANVTANLGAGTASSSAEGSDTLINIENIRTAGGNDNITGSTAHNTIDAGAGDDIVNGLSGDDVIAGKGGIDNISGGDGNDKISGGIGLDTLNGGNNNDIILGDNSYLDGLIHFYRLNEATGSSLTNLGTAGGTLTQGRSYDDNTTVSLSAGDGLDWEYGSPDGQSYLNFSELNNNPRPELPTITLNKTFTISSWVKFDLSQNNARSEHDFVFRLRDASGQNYIDAYRDNFNRNLRVRIHHNGVHFNQYLATIDANEWAHFSYSMDETGYMRLYLNGDLLREYQFNEPLNASTTYSNNYIGLGNHSNERDQMDGGISNFSIHDRVLSDTEVAGLYVDTKTGFDVTATAFDNDIINGGNNNDKLSGGAGSDTINAGSGNDIIEEIADRANDNNNILNGEDGDDIIYSNVANNTINGGNNNDSLRYDHFSNIVTDNLTIDLSAGATFQGTVTNGSETDNFQNIERIHAGSGDDTFIGDAGDNIFYGNAGADNFYGAEGNDQFFGGDGQDIIDFSSAGGGVTARLQTSILGTDINGIVDIDGDSGTDTFTNIENFIGSNFIDTVTGSSVGNLIQTGDGNDIIFASTGSDIINGQNDSDTLDYTAFNQTTTVTTTNISGSLSGNDTFFNIEQINLGAGSDTFLELVTNLFANTIDIDFGAGNDIVRVSSGNISSNIANIADNMTNIERLDLSSATGSTTITGDDVAALTDANNILRLDISSGFSETISSGSNYVLTNTTNNGTHTTYDFTFATQTAQLNLYEV